MGENIPEFPVFQQDSYLSSFIICQCSVLAVMGRAVLEYKVLEDDKRWRKSKGNWENKAGWPQKG